MCNATAGTPSTEVCDGVDNNCDGTIDESGSALCADINACTQDLCGGTSGCLHPPVPDGGACSDGDACTQTDSCQAGACTGTNPVVCTPLDQCHSPGTCNSSTGICSNPANTNGNPCNDGDACTQIDTCQGGTCRGDNPVVCTASDPCHDAGVCDVGTGLCSNPPKTDGSTCSDGSACTQTDTCQAGICQAGPPLDADGDGHADLICGGNDCNDANPSVWLAPFEVTNLGVLGEASTSLAWDGQGALVGVETVYDLASGALSPGSGFSFTPNSCLLTGSSSASFSETRPDPGVDSGFWYLARARNSCGTGTYGNPVRDTSIVACP